MKKINLIAPILGLTAIAPGIAITSCASKSTAFSKILYKTDSQCIVGELMSNVDLVANKEYHFVFDLVNVDDDFNEPSYFDVTDNDCNYSFAKIETISISYAGQALVKDTDYQIESGATDETNYVRFVSTFQEKYKTNPKKQFEITVKYSFVDKASADNISITLNKS